jgi:protein Tex
VKVRVTEVDVARKRIGLSMRKDGAPAPRDDAPKGGKPPRGPMQAGPAKAAPGGLGAALLDAMKRR